MPSRLTSAAVVLAWLSMMGWLIATKVVPPLLSGDPPTYRSIVRQDRPQEPVCWMVHWNGRRMGFAATKIVTDPDGASTVHSRLFLSKLSVADLSPGWLSLLVSQWVPISAEAGVSIDAASRLEIDPLGRLMGFDTQVRLPGKPDAIRVAGRADGSKLRVAFQPGTENQKAVEVTLPGHSLVGDELSPRAQLPGLKLGQTWTAPSYSPFPRQPDSVLDVLQASVERGERIEWNGHDVQTLLVVYRSDPGSTLLASRDPRGRLWVRSDGQVLVQETTVLNSRVRFVRLGDDEGRELIVELSNDWSTDLLAGRGQRLLRQLSEQ